MLTEDTKQRVQHLPESNSIQVQWVDRILRDGVVVSESYRRCAYGAGQRAKFEAEVLNAQNYTHLVDWNAPVPE